MTRIHELKCLPNFYSQVVNGFKTFEVRKDDRGFLHGDVIHLQEFSSGQYSGRSCILKITYILKDFEALVPGYVILGVKVME